MATKTYGYARRAGVPDVTGTHPKFCPKCNLWFAAGKRHRVCDKCTRTKRVDTVNSPNRTTGRKRVITAQTGRSVTTDLAHEALLEDLLTGRSFGCTYPRAQQADHLPSARRHPLSTTRLDESGWCDVPCNCPCHVVAYNAVGGSRE